MLTTTVIGLLALPKVMAPCNIRMIAVHGGLQFEEYDKVHRVCQRPVGGDRPAA